jgi:eukaryotic-like serine/threonine-protein kinase
LTGEIVDRNTFLDLLRESRLLPEQQVGEIAREFGGNDPTQAIASSLISRGLLTPFQARRLAEGQARGLTLGQYRLLEEAGQGGFGRVYKALHAVMGRVVAVKVISPQAAEEARARTWFKREVQAATQLYHPNIVMAYDANEADGLLFLVMEYVDGSDLETLVRKQGPLPIGLACEMMRQAGRALQYAHERGLVHRDIKPANLLIPRPRGTPAAETPADTPPVVKVVDFGLARLHRSVNANSLPSQTEKRFVGTPDYVSPEQVRNASAVDIRSDLYSLGCTFYYALTGRKPFHGESVFEVVVKHLEEEPPPLESVRPEIPAAVSAVVRRLMAKDPAKRFQAPVDLIGELDFLCGKDGAGPAALPLPVLPPTAVEPSALNLPKKKADTGATRCVPALAVESNLASAPPDTEVAPEDPAPVSSVWEIGGSPALVPTVSLVAPPDEKPPAPEQVVPCANGDTLPATVSAAEDGPGERGGGPPTSPPPLDGALRDRWRQWVAVVEAFAAGGESPVHERAYRELDRELLEACRAQAAAGGEAGRLRRLESLVEPWLAPHTFASADRATLASLRLLCRRVDQEVFGSGASWNLSHWIALLVVGLIAGAAGLYFQGTRSGTGPAKAALASLWRVIETHPLLSATIAVPAVILLSLGLVSHLLRGSR